MKNKIRPSIPINKVLVFICILIVIVTSVISIKMWYFKSAQYPTMTPEEIDERVEENRKNFIMDTFSVFSNNVDYNKIYDRVSSDTQDKYSKEKLQEWVKNTITSKLPNGSKKIEITKLSQENKEEYIEIEYKFCIYTTLYSNSVAELDSSKASVNIMIHLLEYSPNNYKIWIE